MAAVEAGSVPHRRAETPAGRLTGRAVHYAVYAVVFAGVYGGLAFVVEWFPRWLLFGILAVSLAKDLLDELRLARGRAPLVYAGVEHAPSNVVLLVLLLGGVLDPAGTALGAGAREWALGLAAFDLLLDLSQDARA